MLGGRRGGKFVGHGILDGCGGGGSGFPIDGSGRRRCDGLIGRLIVKSRNLRRTNLLERRLFLKSILGR